MAAVWVLLARFLSTCNYSDMYTAMLVETERCYYTYDVDNQPGEPYMYTLQGSEDDDDNAYEVSIVPCGTSSSFKKSKFHYSTNCKIQTMRTDGDYIYSVGIGFKILSIMENLSFSDIDWNKDFYAGAVKHDFYASMLYEGYYLSLYEGYCYSGRFSQGLVYFNNRCAPAVLPNNPLDMLSGTSSYFTCGGSYSRADGNSTYEKSFNPSLNCGLNFNGRAHIDGDTLKEEICGGSSTSHSQTLLPLVRGYDVVSGCSDFVVGPPSSNTDDHSANDDNFHSSASGTNITWLIWLIPTGFVFVFICIMNVWFRYHWKARAREAALAIELQQSLEANRQGDSRTLTGGRIILGGGIIMGGGMNLTATVVNPVSNGGTRSGTAYPPGMNYPNEERGNNDYIPSSGNPYPAPYSHYENPYGQQGQASAPPSYNEAVAAPTAPTAAAAVEVVEAHYMRPSEEARYDQEMAPVNRDLPPGYDTK